MTSAAIRDLKNRLSEYVRQAESGRRIAVTAHGRVVAELVPPGPGHHGRPVSRLHQLISAGQAEPPSERGDPTEGWPALRLPKGTVAALINADRGI